MNTKPLSNKTILFLALATGIIVANLNYIQPIEGLIAADFAISKAAVGLLATLTQLGYAFGLLLIVPLGDMLDRRRLILTLLVLSIFALMLAFFAPSFGMFAIASLLVGITSVAAQVIIPFVAYLTPELQQGRVLGTMLSGLLTGILLSRAFSGIIGGLLSWHAVYLIAGLMCFALIFGLYSVLPKDPRQRVNVRYTQVLGSLPKLFRQYRYLRGAAVNGFTLFGVSSVLWSTLAFYLTAQYHLGSSVAGLLGLLGITGVLFAPFIGRMVDRFSPRLTVGMGIFFSALAFGIFWWLGHFMIGLIAGIVLLDLGTQFGQVSNQAIVQSLNREASSRNNSIFMFSYFLGGAVGTFMATWAWSNWGWNGVCLVAVVLLIGSACGHFFIGEPEKLHES